MAEAARKIDRLDLAPRLAVADVVRLNDRFAEAPTQEVLRAVLAEHLLGEVALVSSFGAESAALLHLVASVDPSVPVRFIDTGRHYPETLAYRDLLVARLRLQDFRNVRPDPEVLAARDASELRWSFDPDGCCEIRKVAPLERALIGIDATITGRKAFQASTRNALPRFELDGERIKFNPLADWTKDDIEAYFVEHDLPRHPLVAQGYLSIGCAPCTSVVKPGEDPRAGRWRGWDKTECGLHSAVDDANLPVF